MQLFNKTTLPNSVITWLTPTIARFTCLQTNRPTSAIDYYVAPVGGDRSYTILQNNDMFYVLVTTDHPDPLYDRVELEKLSGKYSFNQVITPDNKVIDLAGLEADDFSDDFFIKNADVYYYCAKVVAL